MTMAMTISSLGDISEKRNDTRLTPIPIRRPKHPQNYGFNPWCKANGANLIPLSPRAWEKGGVSFIIFFFFKAKTKYSDMVMWHLEAFFPQAMIQVQIFKS